MSLSQLEAEQSGRCLLDVVYSNVLDELAEEGMG